MTRYKITFLIDKNNDWIEKKIKNLFKNNNKYFFKIEKNFKKIIKQDIVFILNYTKILPKSFLENNHLNLVVHASDLPKGKGFAPIQWQILKNKNKIPICLVIANEKFDSGGIIDKRYFYLKGHELNDEIRDIQAKETVKTVKNFLKKYPNFKIKQQIGRSTFFRRRFRSDSELNINSNLKKNFNLLRVVDNKKYPAFFKYKNNKYIIKISKIIN